MYDPQVMQYVQSILLFIASLSGWMNMRLWAITTRHEQLVPATDPDLTALIDSLTMLPIPPPCAQLHRDCRYLLQASLTLLQTIRSTDDSYERARAEQQEAIIAIEYEITRLNALYGVQV